MPFDRNGSVWFIKNPDILIYNSSMSLFSWFSDDKKEEDSSPKFVPKINISSKSTLHVEV